MFAFTIPDTKTFMSLLLKGTVFDDFCLRQCEISAFTHISIDGKRDMDYYDENQIEPYCSWAEIKPLVFQGVKGKKTPKQMKLVLCLPQSDMTQYPNASALFWNILFRENTLLCTLSIAQQSFSLDKTDESQWEAWVSDFCTTHGIAIQKEN